MKQGDFTEVAKHYHNRPAYSAFLLERLFACVNDKHLARDDFLVAEIGAGTGKLTKMLAEMGLNVNAIEPNENMRNEGISYTKGCKVLWSAGSGEASGLEAGIHDWVIMASSFHWTDPTRSLPEFARILKNGGYFTAIWNPRDIQEGSVFFEIEEEIKRMIPALNRVSSGAQNTKNWTEILESTGDFENCFFMEIPYFEQMSKERYMGIWHSVNDIQAQAGETWNDVLAMIESKIVKITRSDTILVPYKIRAWSARKVAGKNTTMENTWKKLLGGGAI